MRTSLLLIAALAVPSIASATPTSNGIFLNNKSVNGIFLNGIFLNGAPLNGHMTAAVLGDETIAGVKPTWQAYKPGHYLYYPHLEGTQLAGWAWEWAVGGWIWRTGSWFKDTVMPAGVYDPATGATKVVAIRIANITQPAGVEMPLYAIEVQSTDVNGAELGWQPLCNGPAETHVPAIALRGEWSMKEYAVNGGALISDSPYRVTFACVSGALGKCAASCVGYYSPYGGIRTKEQICASAGIPTALGYKRWLPPQTVDVDGVAMQRDWVGDHQACTRMIRADYCGNGHSWTANGTAIDVYDRTLVNEAVMQDEPLWYPEATWSPEGAVRVTCDRLTEQEVTCSRLDTSPWAIRTSSSTYSFCDATNDFADPRERLGNLRQQTIMLPPIRPILF